MFLILYYFNPYLFTREQNQKEIEEFRRITKYYFNKLLKKDDQENKISFE